MHLEGECMLGGRKPKPLLELLSKGFALIILIKANDPSFAILKSELLFGRLPLYKPSIHILLYISISCTSINLHRSWEEKFSPSKNLDVKNIFPNVLYNLYIQKNAPNKKFAPPKTSGESDSPPLPRPLSVVPFPSSRRAFAEAAEGNHPPSAPRWPPRPQTWHWWFQPTHSPKNMRFKMGKISQLRTWLRFYVEIMYVMHFYHKWKITKWSHK